MDSPRRLGGRRRRVRPQWALHAPSGHEHNEHWGGIAADCKPENKIAMGFVVGVSNKIRVIQRRATAYAARTTCA